MTDSVRLLASLTAIPVLIFSIYGFMATFQPPEFEQVVASDHLMQRLSYGAATAASLLFLIWLVVPTGVVRKKAAIGPVA